MARTEIMLGVRAAALSDDSSGSAIPEVVREMTTDVTAPRLAQFVAKFDDTTAEYLFWQFRLPGNFRGEQETGLPRAHVLFYMDGGQTGDESTVCFRAGLVAVTPRGTPGSPAGDGDEMTSLALSSDGGGWASVSGTLDHADPADAGRLYGLAIDLAGHLDGASGGDYVILGLGRDVSADDASGDACVVSVSLEYTVC
ncbi:MAG: hypothetical protein JXQ73_17640 [Phycisphaerae bacterium]|nr:hypothetical protein [Phycisphaerae bacterium]